MIQLGFVFFIGITGAAQAKSEWSLGAGVIALDMPYKEYDVKATPFPVINYESDSFWIHGLGAGYYLFNDSADKLSIMGYYAPMQFKHKDSDDWKMRHLDTRKGTMMGGVSYTHRISSIGFLRTTVAGDLLNNSKGIIIDTAWLYRYAKDGFSFTPALGVGWNSSNQNDYYYGVSGKESRRSNLEKYDASSAFSPYVEFAVNYRFADNWSIYGVGRWTHLSDEVSDSPMVDASWSGVLSTGVTWTF